MIDKNMIWLRGGPLRCLSLLEASVELTSELLGRDVVASAVATDTAPRVAVDPFLDQMATHLNFHGRTWKLQKYFSTCLVLKFSMPTQGRTKQKQYF